MAKRNGNFVCEACIEERELQSVVRSHLSSNCCDYCGSKGESPIACDLEYVLERIRFAVDQEFTDPANKLPYDSREGGYQGNVIDDTYDLFEHMNLCIDNDDLREDLASDFSGELFVSRDVLGPGPDEFFGSVWKAFKHVVQHQRRFTFWNLIEDAPNKRSAGDVSVGETLAVIAQSINQLSPVIVLPVGEDLIRVQVFESGKSSILPSRYTSPPIKEANQPNRMSPAGIPMFYAAENFETAKAESVDPDRDRGMDATGVCFKTLVPLNILDLSGFYFPRSFFSELDRNARSATDFLTAFAREVSRPIKRDKRQYVQYVPTQVFTEYVRYELRTAESEEFQGIKYVSSITKQACFVVFAEQRDCLPSSTKGSRPKPQMLEFVAGSFMTETIE